MKEASDYENYKLYPLIVTKDAENVIKLFENPGFEKMPFKNNRIKQYGNCSPEAARRAPSIKKQIALDWRCTS